MSTFTRKPAQFPQGQIEGLSTGGEAFGASFGETWETGPTGAADMFQRLQASENLSVGERMLDPLFGIESRKLSPMVSPDDAKQRVKDAGLEGQIPLAQYPKGLRSDTLQILIDANTAKMRRQTIMQQADGWAPQLAGMLVGSLVDPINVASAFIPVVGEARYAQLLARAGGAVGRAGVRVGVGAVEGAVGAAVVEPLIYAGQQQWRNDYDAYDSLLNIAGGAAFGALLHAGAGLAKDALGRPQQVGASSEAIRAEMSKTAAMAQENISVSDIGQRPTIEYVTRATENITPNSAPHRLYRGTREGEPGSGIFYTTSRDYAAKYGDQIEEILGVDAEPLNLSVALDNELDDTFIESMVIDALAARVGEEKAVRIAETFGLGGDGARLPVRAVMRSDTLKAMREAGVVAVKFRQGGAETVAILAEDAKLRMPNAPGTFGDGIARPIVAELDPQTQANALRQALAQDIQGRPIDVTPAMLADPRFLEDPAARAEAVSRAEVNSTQFAAADPQASAAADERVSQVSEAATPLEQAKQALADDEARYREGGGDPESVEFDAEDTKMMRDAVKAATLCMMRSGA